MLFSSVPICYFRPLSKNNLCGESISAGIEVPDSLRRLRQVGLILT
jgi:hypothetical protein